jgi:CDP-4-dehydro-6-deoxyglucose reductase
VRQLTVLPVGVSLPVGDGETILGAMVRSGFLYRFGCRRGGCGVCKVHLVAGEVRYERPVAAAVLSDAERAAGVCLSCRAVPLTDVVIELQEGDRLILASPLLRDAAKRAALRKSGDSATRPGPGEGARRPPGRPLGHQGGAAR